MELTMNVTTLVVSLIALIVAVLALLHERSQSTAHAMLVEITPGDGQRPVEHGQPASIVGWTARIEILGPAPVLQAQPLLFTEGDRLAKTKDGDPTVTAVVDRQLVPIWSPGDAPLELTISRAPDGAMPEEIRAGVTWAEPVPYGKGLISRVRRWQIYVRGGAETSSATYYWCHWGKGRWARSRRPFWRPEPTNRWGRDMKKLPLRRPDEPHQGDALTDR
ncbi:hypothetical protein EDL96_11515 [Kocuria soli]|uniref:Uncharacterized protein n=1 Tax=Kocuria soli TaxID=2485125 RepID=A0A3N3ZRF3_9MICC|nr:hypothetical protein EDL96_11515 [Kocuria soli]